MADTDIFEHGYDSNFYYQVCPISVVGPITFMGLVYLAGSPGHFKVGGTTFPGIHEINQMICQ